jgi:FkbM family methyltransferase
MAATAVTAGDWLLREGKQTLRTLCPRSVLNWREARYYGKYGEVELHILPFMCTPDLDAIDVGANDGSYIHFTKRYARRVHAYEPIPWLAEDLSRKFRQDIQRRKVFIHNMGLSSSSGTTVLRMPIVDGVLVHGCSSVSPALLEKYSTFKEVPVRLVPLDDVYPGDVGFIKIDVEGHEEAVLAGMLKTIGRCQPKMQVEAEESIAPGAIARIAQFFRDLKYHGHFIYQRQLLPIERFDKETMQNPSNYPDLKAPLEQRQRFGTYIYNFLFFPKSEPADTLGRIQQHIATL